MTQRAKFESRSAWLGRPFGEDYARRIFGDSVVDNLPRKTRGQYTGAIKAQIEWLKCIEGGWVSAGRDHMREEAIGRVENRVGSVIYIRLRADDGSTIAEHGDLAYAHLML
jgi:hypothetical protein